MQYSGCKGQRAVTFIFEYDNLYIFLMMIKILRYKVANRTKIFKVLIGKKVTKIRILKSGFHYKLPNPLHSNIKADFFFLINLL